MDEEIKELIREDIKISKENNKLLKKIRNYFRWSSVMRAIYWIFIIGTALGTYYLIQPYVDSLRDAYNGVVSQVDSIVNGSEDN
jgi:hypothetical protein